MYRRDVDHINYLPYCDMGWWGGRVSPTPHPYPLKRRVLVDEGSQHSPSKLLRPGGHIALGKEQMRQHDSAEGATNAPCKIPEGSFLIWMPLEPMPPIIRHRLINEFRRGGAGGG